MNARQRQILTQAAGCLLFLGSANDAEDHGYREDAQRMRAEACTSLRTQLTSHLFLSEFLPAAEEVEGECGRLLSHGWDSALNVIQKTLTGGSAYQAQLKENLYE